MYGGGGGRFGDMEPGPVGLVTQVKLTHHHHGHNNNNNNNSSSSSDVRHEEPGLRLLAALHSSVGVPALS